MKGTQPTHDSPGCEGVGAAPAAHGDRSVTKAELENRLLHLASFQTDPHNVSRPNGRTSEDRRQTDIQQQTHERTKNPQPQTTTHHDPDRSPNDFLTNTNPRSTSRPPNDPLMSTKPNSTSQTLDFTRGQLRVNTDASHLNTGPGRPSYRRALTKRVAGLTPRIRCWY